MLWFQWWICCTIKNWKKGMIKWVDSEFFLKIGLEGMFDFSFHFGCYEQCSVRWLCSYCYIKELEYLFFVFFFNQTLLLKYRGYPDWFLKRDGFFPMIFLERWLRASLDNNRVHAELLRSVSLALLLLYLFVCQGFNFHIEICHYSNGSSILKEKEMVAY